MIFDSICLSIYLHDDDDDDDDDAFVLWLAGTLFWRLWRWKRLSSLALGLEAARLR